MELLVKGVVALIIILTCSSHIYAAGLCAGSNASLDCLMKHSNQLYAENIDLFWDILNKAAQKAEQCKKPEDTAHFLALVGIQRDGDLQEYYHKKIEDLCVLKTKCFLDALLIMSPFDQDRVLSELENPIYVSKPDIKRALSKFKRNVKYGNIIRRFEKKI